MFVRALLDTIFPPRCHVCRSFIPEPLDIHVCVSCREKIETVRSPLCPVCGIPFATAGGIDHQCGQCLSSRRPFDVARAAMRYDDPLQELIHRFKYGKKVHLARPLALLTADMLDSFIDSAAPDSIVPVPLHRKRLRQRGFNQSQLLGNVLAKRLRIPLSVHNLRRIRWTEPQTGLSAADRERNIRGAFAVARPELVRGKCLLLVDDVYTTGSTASECARTLKSSGARKVVVVTVARSLM